MTLEPIARFHAPFGENFGIPRQSGLVESLRGEIRFEARYRQSEAFRGLERFDYIWILWGFDRNRRESGSWHATVRPPRLGGNRSAGVFATRSPYRPNPIGLSSVRLERIDPDTCTLHVRGADLADGTPIYDIKPYLPYTDAHPDASGGWTDTCAWNELEVVFPGEFSRLFSDEDARALRQLLAQDPRPHYQDDPDKVYGMLFAGHEIKFRVDSGTLTVISVEK